SDIVPEVYFSGPSVSKQGAVAGSRRLRTTLRLRMEDLIQIGIPTNRLGVMLTFSSTPHAGGREGLALPQWLDVVKWEEIAVNQISSELHLASVWSWGWAAFNPAGNDPDKPKAACTWLWTRDHSLCDAPAVAGTALDPSLQVGATLPAGTLCLLGTTKLLASDVAAISRLTGDRDVAFSAEYEHAVLVAARPVSSAELALAERNTILDHFGGSRQAYLAGLASAHVTHTLAREILADEVRRLAVEATLRIATPTTLQLRNWYGTYSAVKARAVRAAAPMAWLGGARAGIALQGEAPGRLFDLAPGQSVKVDGVKVTALGETAPLGAYPYAVSLPAVRQALVAQQRLGAFATWARRRQNQSLGQLACQHDKLPRPATIDLTGWVPFLSLG
ncbi:MAG: hypothetical protein ACRDLK_12500, partial [Gaiellaceae bacterium]